MIRRALALLLVLTPVLPAAAQSPEPVRVTADFQAWVDGNRDGILQPDEIDQLLGAFLRLLGEPHPGNNPLDAMFDVNHDGRIDPGEMDRAWMEIILPRLPRLIPGNPDAARLLDVNDDGRIGDEEALLAVEYLAHDRAAMQPHKAGSPLDGRVDANHDGRVGAEEIAAFRERLVRAAMLLPVEGPPPGEPPAHGRGFLDELADVNGDGNLDPEEQRQREAGMRGPHPVETPFDQRLDANGNGRVEQAEIL